ADAHTMQWIVEAYVVVLAAFTLIGGSLADRYGRRRCYAWGVTIFAAASVVCAVAVDAPGLIGGRLLQGIGGALLLPGGLAIIAACFSAQERAVAIGSWAAFGAITGMAAPALCGLLVEHSWRWIFLLNLPLAALTLTLLLLAVPESRDPDIDGPPDWAGGALAALGLASLVAALLSWPRAGLSDAMVMAELAGSAILLTAFYRVEKLAAAPMLPLTLFREPLFAGINLATLTLYTGLNGLMFFLPFTLIQVRHFTPLETGLTMLPMGAAIFLLSRYAGRLVTRNPRLPLLLGPCLVAAAYLLLGHMGSSVTRWMQVAPATLLLGTGMALCISPISELALAAAPPGRAGVASGVNNAVARIASVLAIAALGAVLVVAFDRHLADALSRLEASPSTLDHFATEKRKLALAQAPENLPAARRQVLNEAVQDAYLAGFRSLCQVAAALALLSAAICYRTITVAGIPSERRE
ncbi:MAG: MFS transporter, partial [Pseudomonadota bacterium]|nr:MFS transporter [Pseudomonadota bacterium]